MEINPAADTNRATEIKSKMHFTGTVKTITLAGAVIDIGVGTPAVLHISQMAASTEGQPIKSVREVLQEGQTIDVWVRRVKDNRVELTMFRPLDLEWRDLKKGMVVKGKVVAIEKDIAVIDISMPRLSGIDVVRRLTEELPRTRVLVLTMHEDEEYVLHVVRAGASGYLLKDSPISELIGAVKALKATASSRISRASKRVSGSKLDRKLSGPDMSSSVCLS